MTQVYDDTSDTIKYSGNWSIRSLSNWSNGSLHICTATTDAAVCNAKMTFTGTSIDVIGSLIPGRGMYYCYLDDQTPWMWYDTDTTDVSSKPIGTVCGVSNLTYGVHTVTYGQVTPTLLTYTGGNRNGIPLDGYSLNRTIPNGVSTGTPVWSGMTPPVDPPAGWENTTVYITATNTTATFNPSTAGFTTITRGASTSLPSSTSLISAASATAAAASEETKDSTSPPVGVVAGSVCAAVVILLAGGIGYCLFKKSKRARKSKALSSYSYS